MNFIEPHMSEIWRAIIILALCTHAAKLSLSVIQIKYLNRSLLQLNPSQVEGPDHNIEEILHIHGQEIQKFTLKVCQSVLAVAFFLGMTFFGGLNSLNEFLYQEVYTRNLFNLNSELYQTTIIGTTCLLAATWMHIIAYPLSKFEESPIKDLSFFGLYNYKFFYYLFLSAFIVFPIIWLSTINYWWFVFITLTILIWRIYIDWIHPTFISPLLLEKSMAPSDLNEAITNLASKIGFNIINTGITHNENTINKNNIYILGGKKSRIILFNDSLTDNFNTDELSCMAATEIGRRIFRHNFYQSLNRTLILIAFLVLSNFLIDKNWYYEALNIITIQDAPYIGVFVATTFMVLFAFAPIIEFCTTYFSRRRVFHLDAFTSQFCDVRLIFDITEKLKPEYQRTLLYHPIYSKIFNPDPSLEERRSNLNHHSTEIVL